jgi:hypothetical protein
MAPPFIDVPSLTKSHGPTTSTGHYPSSSQYLVHLRPRDALLRSLCLQRRISPHYFCHCRSHSAVGPPFPSPRRAGCDGTNGKGAQYGHTVVHRVEAAFQYDQARQVIATLADWPLILHSLDLALIKSNPFPALFFRFSYTHDCHEAGFNTISKWTTYKPKRNIRMTLLNQ